MAIDEKIADKKAHDNIDREAKKISALSSDKLVNSCILQVKKYYPPAKPKR